MSTSRKTPIRLGIEAENMGQPALDPGIVATAKAAEAAGVQSISVSDHLLSFDIGDSIWLEAMASLAAISSATNRAKLVTSVIILPQRNVLEFLRDIHTLHTLSNGRLVVGVGSGWDKREMEALGYDFGNRGQRMDEMLQVIRSVDAGAVPAFTGNYVRVPDGITIAPHPNAGENIPLYIGGSASSKVSVRRALQFGDGWMVHSMAGDIDREAMEASLQRLRSERDQQGLPHLYTVYKLGVTGVDDPHMITGVQKIMDMGFDEVIVQGVWGQGIEPGMEAIHRIQQVIS